MMSATTTKMWHLVNGIFFLGNVNAKCVNMPQSLHKFMSTHTPETCLAADNFNVNIKFETFCQKGPHFNVLGLPLDL